MNNNTRDDYKKAVRAKYEIEKEGEYSNYFSPTSQANLRNLCWERFKENNNSDDLITFNDFFEFKFDLTKKNHFSSTTDKFRPIVTFLKGEKEPANFYSVEMAAILVDFQPRPFKKFKEKGIIKLDEPKQGPKLPEPFFVAPEDSGAKVEEGENKTPIDEKPLRKSILDTFNKKARLGIISTIILGLIGAVIYFYMKKDCMQWTGDHYEKVDCVQEMNSFVGFNTIKPFDEVQFKLKKINVCDTTTCFKNEQAIIWYGKISNQVDFFNMNGLNPLNGKPLRPITDHMFHKYKGDCKTKKSGSAN
ncbi:MAG: hypothetical protein EOO44_13170 [Flavobacterium sp.]|nr:MAG: hypothetical protein EOO44_13170 [Flavobacterium sp.]